VSCQRMLAAISALNIAEILAKQALTAIKKCKKL
jgi:hypothetical protein